MQARATPTGIRPDANPVDLAGEDPVGAPVGLQVTAMRFDNGVPGLDGAVDPGPMQVRGSSDDLSVATEDPMAGMLIGARNGSPFIQLR